MSTVSFRLFAVLWIGLSIRFVATATAAEPLEIRESIKLEAGKVYGPLIIKASNITIDGNGAVVQGATQGNSKDFHGIGILADGVDGVSLKRISVKGFEIGLKISNAKQWLVDDCDLSSNFHDPEFGWGENGRRGGIVLFRVNDSKIRNCKARNNWDACCLIESNGNTLAGNDFSRCSNTCLKFWTACNNTIEKNNLSYGLRISPGEVHARDSTSVLIESGSDGNKLIDNDCTHGGDGIFVRVLNGWCSIKNEFIGNDCSFANNNAVECWSPRNRFERNKANHSSYGFWMGGSDKTTLIDNEASYNGLKDGFHNSPHLPNDGHAGIVFMFGPGSHCVAQGNKCENNNGAGIALIGDQGTKGEKWKAYHWILKGNTLTENRWGVFLEYADWIDLIGNKFAKNQSVDLFVGTNVTRLNRDDHPLEIRELLAPSQIRIDGPTTAIVKEDVRFSLLDSSLYTNRSPRRIDWDFGHEDCDRGENIEMVFRRPGFVRIGVTLNHRSRYELDYRDFYVVDALLDPATEGDAARWTFVAEPNLKITYANDRNVHLAGDQSLAVTIDPYHGSRATMCYPETQDAGWKLEGKQHLVFWFKANNSNIPGWQDVNPVITIGESRDKMLKLTPKADLLSQLSYNEAREGWRYFEIPLKGDANWEVSGTASVLNWLTLGVDSWGSDPLHIWLDGLTVR